MKRLFLSSLATLALAIPTWATEPAQVLPGMLLQADGKADPAKPAAPAPAALTAPPVTGCCNACVSCDDCGRCGHILADVGFYIFKPYWKTNPAMFIDDNAPATVAEKDFTDASQFVPRVSFGYVNGNGFGARIGWWGFATSQTDFVGNNNNLAIFSASPLGLPAADDFFGDPGEGMAASYALRMNVWDFELLQVFERNAWTFLLSGGIRYAHVSMDYFAIDVDEPGDLVTDFVNSGHNFNGAGPTVALQVRGGQNLYVTCTARGSLLFGPGKQNAQIALTTPAGPVLLNEAISSYDEILPVGELELGVGGKRAMARAIAFLELGVNAQAWIEAGNAARSTGFNEFGDVFNHGTISDPTLGLFGFYLRTGLTY